MKCPYRIKETTVSDYRDSPQYVKYREFDSCYGDECPFYYQDDNAVDKCSRCEIQEEL